jgi:GAF domain-containing protein
MHFASRHELKPPDARPSAWLRVPLQTANKPIGALVVQRYPPSPSFNRRSREVLLAVAGQANAAIQNARLYQETVRLYNLTDEALAQRVK